MFERGAPPPVTKRTPEQLLDNLSLSLLESSHPAILSSPVGNRLGYM